jgi:hypothetical protein
LNQIAHLGVGITPAFHIVLQTVSVIPLTKLSTLEIHVSHCNNASFTKYHIKNKENNANAISVNFFDHCFTNNLTESPKDNSEL